MVNGGANYSTETVITIFPAQTSPGAGATAIPVVTPSTLVSLDYYNVWVGANTSAEITDQLSEVTSFFQSLGYTIKLEASPLATAIQWHLYW